MSMLFAPVKDSRIPAWEVTSIGSRKSKPIGTVSMSRRGLWSIKLTPGLTLNPWQVQAIAGAVGAGGTLEMCGACKQILAKARKRPA